jgi:histidine triad (HIT) family protein
MHILSDRCWQEEASIVFEDDETLAIMDLRQANEGKVLVLPRRHVETIYELDEDLAACVSRTVVRVARAVRAAFNPPGLNIWQSNGEVAGQEIPHVHFHVFPRTEEDGCFNLYSTFPADRPRTELDALAARIRAALSEQDSDA